jgi:hypothetical protein
VWFPKFGDLLLKKKQFGSNLHFKKRKIPNYFQFSLLPSGEKITKIKIKIITARLVVGTRFE